MATVELAWNAPGAPTLSGTAGSFRNLIRTFLESAGWTVVWENAGAQKLVMRNSLALGGSGAYIRILDTAATTATFRLYESMSNIDTGTAPTRQYSVIKASASGATPRPYSLIGDARTFYGTLLGDHTDVPPVEAAYYYGYTTFLGGGDIHPAVPGDPGIFATGRTSTDQYLDNDVFLVRTSSAARDGLSLTRSNALSASATNVKFLTSGYTNESEVIGHNSTMFSTSATPAYIPAVLSTSTSSSVIRGRLRGVFLPLHQITLARKLIGSVDTPILTATPRSLGVYTSGCAGNSFRAAIGIDKGTWDA